MRNSIKKFGAVFAACILFFIFSEFLITVGLNSSYNQIRVVLSILALSTYLPD